MLEGVPPASESILVIHCFMSEWKVRREHGEEAEAIASCYETKGETPDKHPGKRDKLPRHLNHLKRGSENGEGRHSASDGENPY